MFFPTRIKSIRKGDRVLEVGPGNNPFYRSDVLLEKRFDDEAVALKQAGGVAKRELRQQIVYYDGGPFPFEDNAFDYVICSHVLEHVPVDGIERFISELTRVAGRGYIEFPLYRFELLNDIQYHVNLINVDDSNRVYILDKKRVDLSCDGYSYLKDILRGSLVAHKVTSLNPERLCAGFEFSAPLDYRIVEGLDDILAVKRSGDDYLDTRLTVSLLFSKIARQFHKNIFLQKWQNRSMRK